ncbi:MAG: 23S rRNA pseudouridine(955/2504/2580) synthase RluC [Pseudomonadota bacterium]|nr:MAG: 23S rRNA pseudouridine(955/2504/2580) synthase RluC [Pseudomonadota bacterium]
MKNPGRPAGAGVRHIEVDSHHTGQRLDNFLIRTLKGLPKSRVYRLLRKGEVRVNGGRVGPDYRLEEGDRIRIPPVRMAPPDTAPAPDNYRWLNDRILYEDEALLAVDKPAGLAVHAGSGVATGLIEALRAVRPDEAHIELVHRLDRETSGCLLLAKDRSALTALHRQLREGEMDKRYLALVRGRWRGRGQRVRAALEKGRLQSGERMVRVAEDGRESESHFLPRHVYGRDTLVEIRLKTGRTHQARVHATHLGHPIAGDDKYGDREFNRELRARGLRRLFLHAASLAFRHPVTRQHLRVEAPLPAELQSVLERLDAEA